MPNFIWDGEWFVRRDLYDGPPATAQLELPSKDVHREALERIAEVANAALGR